MGPFKCPELYYLENGNYVPNDATPLLWTQANLWIAFKFMKQNLPLTIKNPKFIANKIPTHRDGNC